ncbi:hypothetical protein C0J52_24699 [Blattella germanica]|nr:hypothetical protein C0J52_24699 [Blattella germanica]PSN33324.1 hypothetical protein C0J52_24699 [Blattella germanica]
MDARCPACGYLDYTRMMAPERPIMVVRPYDSEMDRALPSWICVIYLQNEAISRFKLLAYPRKCKDAKEVPRRLELPDSVKKRHEWEDKAVKWRKKAYDDLLAMKLKVYESKKKAYEAKRKYYEKKLSLLKSSNTK